MMLLMIMIFVLGWLTVGRIGVKSIETFSFVVSDDDDDAGDDVDDDDSHDYPHHHGLG